MKMLRVALAVVCGTAAIASDAAEFNVLGTVLQVRPESQSFVAAHEDIPGFMPAMTMPFRVLDAQELAGLKKNDRVQFVFVVDDRESYAKDVRVLASGQAGNASEAALPAAPAKKVREGDRAPLVRLLDQHGRPISLVDPERWTVMTFIFTRCPVPEFCPRMSGNFRAVQGLVVAHGLEHDVRLLSVTIDPEFDTASLLEQYGRAVGAEFSIWSFATAEPAEIDGLTEAFRVFVRENGVTLDHTLCTALIAPDGEIRKIWRGNAWTADEVFAALPAGPNADARERPSHPQSKAE